MVNDYGQLEAMEEIAISKFKATCLSVLEQVRKTRKPVLVTRFGKPIAEVVPPSVPERRNELWISPVSLWEVLVLCRKRRLDIGGDPAAWISTALAKVPFREAPLTHEVALATENIALPHRDPADSFLAASAKVYGLTLVTADRNLLAGSGYSVLRN